MSLKDKNFINLYDLEDEEKVKNSLISGKEALKKIFPVVQVKKKCVKKLLTGNQLSIKMLSLGK